MVTSLIFPFLVYQFGDGLQITFANALRGISDVKLMMLIAFIAYFIISLPVGYFCGFVMGWGVVGVWMAFPFGLTSAGLMLWWRFHYMTKLPTPPSEYLILKTLPYGFLSFYKVESNNRLYVITCNSFFFSGICTSRNGDIVGCR